METTPWNFPLHAIKVERILKKRLRIKSVYADWSRSVSYNLNLPDACEVDARVVHL